MDAAMITHQHPEHRENQGIWKMSDQLITHLTRRLPPAPANGLRGWPCGT
jgi:hypothetical protein